MAGGAAPLASGHQAQSGLIGSGPIRSGATKSGEAIPALGLAWAAWLLLAGMMGALTPSWDGGEAHAEPVQAVPAQAEDLKASTSVAPVTVKPAPCAGGASSQGAAGANCAAARIGQAAALAVPSARSNAITLGIPTPSAVAQQFGPNFGKSVIPYRPAPPAPAASPFSRRP
jgi:hypothetical protein